jgi:hypothetical protein
MSDQRSPEEAIAIRIEETFEALRENAETAATLAAATPAAGRPFQTPELWWAAAGGGERDDAGDAYRSWLNDLLPDAYRASGGGELPNESRRELLRTLAADFRAVGSEAGDAYAVVFETAGQETVTLAGVCRAMARANWLAAAAAAAEEETPGEKSWCVGPAATAARAAGWGPHPEVRTQTDADLFVAAAGLTNVQYLAEFEPDIYLAAYVAEAFLIPRN